MLCSGTTDIIEILLSYNYVVDAATVVVLFAERIEITSKLSFFSDVLLLRQKCTGCFSSNSKTCSTVWNTCHSIDCIVEHHSFEDGRKKCNSSGGWQGKAHLFSGATQAGIRTYLFPVSRLTLVFLSPLPGNLKEPGMIWWGIGQNFSDRKKLIFAQIQPKRYTMQLPFIWIWVIKVTSCSPDVNIVSKMKYEK